MALSSQLSMPGLQTEILLVTLSILAIIQCPLRQICPGMCHLVTNPVMVTCTSFRCLLTDPISNIATNFFDDPPGIREYSISPRAKANKATLTLGVPKMSAGLRQFQRAPASEDIPLEDSGVYTHASTVDWSHHPVAQPADRACMGETHGYRLPLILFIDIRPCVHLTLCGGGPNRNNVDLVY
ncbi:hypothetical protein EDB86DRAFT_2916868 [Lactarius hatsudake]|nr:hypothetical protein EDB86DRAFT_2916868 [Lactarius hatsudake]